MLWNDFIEEEKEYFKKIQNFLIKKRKNGINVYPNENDIFKAYNLCSYNKTKIVIIGQDPYHTPNTAHGLCFSSKQIKRPPSLRNIFLEIYDDLKPKISFDEYFQTNDLTYWGKCGAFLLNTTLTVDEGKANSHSEIGWKQFTTKTIQILNDKNEPIVFMLWGSHAISYQEYITNKNHLILTAPHPSPFSAHTGFFGCKHFSKANYFLKLNYNKKFDFRTLQI
jgi:uracil-DNA glycosylase